MTARAGRSGNSLRSDAEASHASQAMTPLGASVGRAPEWTTTVATKPALRASTPTAAPPGPVMSPTMPASSTWSASSRSVSCREIATVPTPPRSPAA
ncbi:unannotated protein [freshwater metagenome]|uniref:Unannotated protein n=1 Tax=freshwater metagenome TaxID=449393 RepID=A0A6J6UFC4_9ZZZZ